MVCKNCGTESTNGAKFCPKCGTPIEHYEDVISNDSKKSSKKSKKESKNLPRVIIAAVLVLAIAAGTVFGVLKLTNGYSKDNPFYTQSKNVKKSTSNYDVLTVLAATYNTFFNSKSFAFKTDIEDIEGKVQFGKNLADSCFLVDLDYASAVMYDGLLLLNEDGYGASINVKELYDNLDEVSSKLVEELEDADQDEYAELLGDSSADLIESIQGIVKNKKLNMKNIDLLFAKCCELLFEVRSSYYDTDMFENIPTLTNALDIIARFIASADEGAFDVKKDKDTYKISVNGAKLSSSLIDFLNDNDDVSDILDGCFGDGFVDNIIDEIEDFDDFDDLEDYELKVTIKNNYINEIKLKVYGDSVKVTISDINKTKITKDDYEDVESKIDDYEIEIDDVDDVIDEIA